MNQAVPPLAQGTLDRDAPTRLDETLLAAAWHEPGARLLRLRPAEIPVIGDSQLALVPTDGEWTPATADSAVHHVYLGRIEGAPMFARAATPDEAADADAQWRPTFDAAVQLSESERELVAAGSALLRWHDAAKFSGVDGALTSPVQGGWARVDASGREFFPRTDPAVIVLIEHEGRVLLGSNALWETGRFSLLAGFVEAGESLEQAARREVFEESGVTLGDVQYVGSQPWPFPRSLMLGFRATLAPGHDPEALQADVTEISELRWFSRDELRTPPPGVILPGSLSIARWMMDRWCEEGETELGH
ncbi:NAD+ diphosphatase [Leucobacter exalbidus]|uniref:NAD(+) diphosphatase n=1 Tax=Leucobacter exalbidus TaxID=662960 RepID=A0A940PT89_9MICO|nr:NAD(+) diphosphatase [Leucobacter exalbidus]MBP1324816.1 NAD+ diphosphatase [Leucobacter exalbidus]